MSKGRGPWDGGQRAWKRLGVWHAADPVARPGDAYDGARALEALDDVGHVRHLLDQVELVAVRTARRHGKSWAEIATRLGVTRQSAWERWRDLDDGAAAPDIGSDPAPGLFADAAAGLVERATNERRRSATVTVPDVIGLGWDEAIDVLRGKRLVGVGPDVDGPPLATIGWPGGVVTDQSPESGAKVPAGSPVTLWVERGGSAGVREPRRPKPDPKVAHEERFESSDEAIG